MSTASHKSRPLALVYLLTHIPPGGPPLPHSTAKHWGNAAAVPQQPMSDLDTTTFRNRKLREGGLFIANASGAEKGVSSPSECAALCLQLQSCDARAGPPAFACVSFNYLPSRAPEGSVAPFPPSLLCQLNSYGPQYANATGHAAAHVYYLRLIPHTDQPIPSVVPHVL